MHPAIINTPAIPHPINTPSNQPVTESRVNKHSAHVFEYSTSDLAVACTIVTCTDELVSSAFEAAQTGTIFALHTSDTANK
jgi:hypothetical protein